MSVSICFYYNSTMIIFCFKYFEIKFLKHFVKMKISSGAPVARRAAKRSPISNIYMRKKGNTSVDFLMVIMANGIARGRVRTTAATTTLKSRNMAAILQITGWQKHAALVHCVRFWYWIPILWSTDTCQNKVSAGEYHVNISRSQVNSWSRLCFFEIDRSPNATFLLGSRAHVWLTCWKQGRIVREGG